VPVTGRGDGVPVSIGVEEDDAATRLQGADGGQAGRGQDLGRAGADQLRLLPTGQRLERAGARRNRDQRRLDLAAAAIVGCAVYLVAGRGLGLGRFERWLVAAIVIGQSRARRAAALRTPQGISCSVSWLGGSS